ncbi:MAG: SPOR domain-containing protein [Anaeromicrobium sp.]|jgi:hypothetical protein|uniref:SPOR domain-containing protein n=1 Tax=Anaeromicrobium sp. TaxID=1929132 RepID=UPI0025EB89A8|nr:SPOR domain-containing protein [Anaeromicrobium sp.]MCT4594930.1 SPOR domain-containing protein [Anaeromicrobium sp.]
MRRNRRGFRKESKYKKFLFLLIFCILLPAIAIYGGFYASRYVILPAIMYEEDINKEVVVDDTQEKKVENTDETRKVEKSPSQSKEMKYTMKGITIYGIQIGSFTSLDNAKIQLKELKEKNIIGRIVERNNYKVIVGFGFERETIQKAIPLVKEHFKEAFVFEQYIKEKDIMVENNDKEYVTKLNQVNEKIFEEMEKIEKYIIQSKEKQVEISSSEIEKNIKEIKGLEKELKDININNRGKEFKEEYTSMVGELIKGLSNEISSVNVETGMIEFLDKYSKLHTNN